ncbi:UPF0210 protein LBUL_0934 [Striga asiatica]|uniref:UPF0210 protein LBUL_0934 n=1 Tax=Striga asiatica TaxID=4170 RepID=A0A5A7PU18_STRAF|nr:UPF0210 protein LBUL_0934 [Striga asiatica]
MAAQNAKTFSIRFFVGTDFAHESRAGDQFGRKFSIGVALGLLAAAAAGILTVFEALGAICKVATTEPPLDSPREELFVSGFWDLVTVYLQLSIAESCGFGSIKQRTTANVEEIGLREENLAGIDAYASDLHLRELALFSPFHVEQPPDYNTTSSIIPSHR